uniref:Tetraspanin n=1 Tax=Monopterus albus TaxID=43700 RepID=A0A3Q3K0H5_MONAL|nr:CD82 antigen-like [Monopterus albus]
MKLQLKIQLLKFCSAVFNSIFLVLGLSVAGCAIWILFDTENLLAFLSSEELCTVAFTLLVIGGVVMVVSVVGCVGAEGKHRFLLLVYLGALIVLILGQLFVALLLLINRNKIEQTLGEVVDQIIFDYGGNSTDRLLDRVQRYGQCCGRTGPSDWLKNSYIQSLNLTDLNILPCSCFIRNRPSMTLSWCSELVNFTEPLYKQGNSSYTEGCQQKLSDWLQENGLTVIGMDLSLILIQVVQVAVAVYLYQAFGRKASLKKSNRLAGLDHAPDEDLDSSEQMPDDAYLDPNYPECYPENTNLGFHHED